MSFFRSTSELSATLAEAVPPVAGSPETEVMSAQHTSEILDEAILASSSRVRDSLPEQYHKHFETLRDEIIDFAQAHGIPRDTLAKPDALREAAKKLSIPDLKRLANLFERFKHLLVHHEFMKEEIDPAKALEYAEKYYHLEKQYTSQVELLEQAGILKGYAILGIDGNKYLIPTLEQIAIRLFERREDLETKHDQGFTKLLLVPFGMSLDILRETLKRFLLDYKKKNPDFYLNIDDPFQTLGGYQGADIGDSPKLVYYPQSFDEDDHQGMTKMEILGKQETPGQARGDRERQSDNGWRGWTIHLLQPSNMDDKDTEIPKGFALIPEEGQGTTQGNRPSLEADKTPNKYLSILKEAKYDPNSPYFQESGMTPEDWIMAFMLHLQETGKSLDDMRNPTNTESASYLTGAFFQFSIRVPCAFWSCKFQVACLGEKTPHGRDNIIGIRSSVVI